MRPEIVGCLYRSDLEFSDISIIFCFASIHGRLNILDWLLENKADSFRNGNLVEDNLMEDIMIGLINTDASSEQALAVLKWWQQSGLPINFDAVMDEASVVGWVDVLD